MQLVAIMFCIVEHQKMNYTPNVQQEFCYLTRSSLHQRQPNIHCDCFLMALGGVGCGRVGQGGDRWHRVGRGIQNIIFKIHCFTKFDLSGYHTRLRHGCLGHSNHASNSHYRQSVSLDMEEVVRVTIRTVSTKLKTKSDKVYSTNMNIQYLSFYADTSRLEIEYCPIKFNSDVLYTQLPVSVIYAFNCE